MKNFITYPQGYRKGLKRNLRGFDSLEVGFT